MTATVLGAAFAITNIDKTRSKTSCSSRKPVKITDVEAALIARKLKGVIDLPGIPNMIEQPIVEQVIKMFIDVCPLILPEEVFNKLIAGDAGANGISETLIRQINDAIYVPIISKEAQNAIVEQLCVALFNPSNFETVRRTMVARTIRDVMNTDSRLALATQLNENIDIPLVSEENEQIVAEKLVNTCFDLLETFIPASIRDMLHQTSPEELNHMRNSIVTRLSDKIDVPFASEEVERKALTFIVDFFLAFYGLQEGTKNPVEQLFEVEHELKFIELELEAYQEISFDKIKKMKAKQIELKKKRKQVAKIVYGSSWLSTLKFW